MPISLVESAIRNTGIASYAFFFASNLRHKGRKFRIALAYVGYHCLITIVASTLNVRLGELNPVAYYVDVAIDFILQVGIVIEIAFTALGKARLPPKIRLYLLGGLGIGFVLAGALALSLSNVGLSGRESWDMRIDVFTSMLVCTLIIGFLAITLRFRIRRSLHVSGIGRGLTLWSAVALLCDLSNLYTRGLYMRDLDEVSNASWVLMITYWAYVLWRDDRIIGQSFTAEAPGIYSSAV